MTAAARELRVALVADWITDHGGAERLFEHLMQMFPQADVLTSVVQGDHPMLSGRRVKQTWLAKLPFLAKRHKWAAIFRPYAFRHLDLSAYDLVISAASAEAKHVIVRPGVPHICYCHTPTRYYWSHTDDYLANPGFGRMDRFFRVGLRLLLQKMRALDLEAAQRVTQFLANSNTTAERILRYYGKQAIVVYSSISLDRFGVGIEPRNGYLAVGRIVPYKRFDLLVEAFNRSKRPLTIVSSIRNELADQLVAQSGPNIQWHFALPEDDKIRMMQQARAVMFPQEEDLGLVPIEATACGTPVIAYRAGGAVDTVIENVSGVFFDEQTVESLEGAITEFETREWSPERVRTSAERFSRESFERSIQQIVADALAGRLASETKPASTN